jgi:hypothetical protein
MAAKLKIEKRGDEILNKSGHNFGKGPSNDFHQSLVLIELLVPDKMVFM